ncbi:MAG: ATP-binding protein, partial [Pseudomonadota bacterium]
MADNAGTLSGIGMIGNDLTQWRRTEEQLRHAQKMKAVGQLTGGLAHDFNNILQAIAGNLELLAKCLPAGEESARYTDQAIEAASAGSRLTERLLAASRRQILSPEPLLLNDILDAMGELIAQTVGDKVNVVFGLQPDLWHCEADLSQLENAVLNLAINARDAMPSGGRLRFVTDNVVVPPTKRDTLGKLAPGDYVRLTVTDEGEGMSTDIVDRAFEPFFTTKTIGAGSGLGLSTIYGFAMQSGGHVDIDSAPGEGTRVYLCLPRSDRSLKAADRVVERRAPAGNGELVLVVEDNTHVLRLTEALLRSLRYRSVAVPTAPEAIELMESGVRVDVLLTDVVLPGGLSGAELARYVMAHAPETGIVLMSGLSADTLFDGEGLDDDLGPVLQKPFREDALAR